MTVTGLVETVDAWHDLLDAVELGPGGDHDEPYVYQPAAQREVAAAWTHLGARMTRGELGGPMDGGVDARRRVSAA